MFYVTLRIQTVVILKYFLSLVHSTAVWPIGGSTALFTMLVIIDLTKH